MCTMYTEVIQTLPRDQNQITCNGTANCNMSTDEPTDSDDQSRIPSQDVLKKNSALFLLGLKEKFKLTQHHCRVLLKE